MERTKIRDILKTGLADQTVTLCGWVRSRRESKTFAFLVLNDGSCQATIQCIIDQNIPGFDLLARCQTGASVCIVGTLKPSQGKGQAWEVHAQKLDLFGEAPAETYPLQKKGHTLEFLREIGHLRGRTNTFGAVWRVRNALAHGVHEFFQGRGFVWAHTPIITANDCEGAGEMFTVTTLDVDNPKRTDKGAVDWSQDFFGKHSHLTVSGQLQGEFLALSLGDIYTFGPTFRAENSNTTRHLSEFWMIEPEMAFADLSNNMDLAEDFIRFLCKWVVEKCPDEMMFLVDMYKGMSMEDILKLSETKFARMTYTDAVRELEKATVKFEFPVKWGTDLQSEHERYLTDQIFKGPVIVTDYPKDFKSFYMRLNDDGKTVAAMDVLVPRIGEIIGGSQREDRLDFLERMMTEKKIPVEDLQWFLDLRRFGSVPHAGFGLGFERMVQYMTGMGNIRDVIPCPRSPHSVSF
ncbi:MAG: asparagine--tRNA ligase [Proteobacteria bacterium]|nr:asparagine--tRNA ligase [Pseudomonadota bacterium]